MKRKLTILLVVLMILGSVAYAAEESHLDLYKDLLNRYWKETNLEPPPIEGHDDFKKSITRSLELLKEKCPGEYKVVVSFTKLIELDFQYVRKEAHSTAYADGTIRFNGDHFNKLLKETKSRKDDLAKLNATILVHETTHLQQFVVGMVNENQTQFTIDDLEVMACLAEYRVAKKLGLGKEGEKVIWEEIEEHLKK